MQVSEKYEGVIGARNRAARSEINGTTVWKNGSPLRNKWRFVKNASDLHLSFK
ncbi:MAG: hypothetical protein ACLUEV_03725 [Alistipes sp.]